MAFTRIPTAVSPSVAFATKGLGFRILNPRQVVSDLWPAHPWDSVLQLDLPFQCQIDLQLDWKIDLLIQLPDYFPARFQTLPSPRK